MFPDSQNVREFVGDALRIRDGVLSSQEFREFLAVMDLAFGEFNLIAGETIIYIDREA